MNSAVRDNLRYLKGLDGVPTIESGLVIDNTGGDEYLKLPLLTTAECTSVLNAEGEVAFDEQTHRAKYYNGSAVGSVVTTIDVDDTPVDSATTDPISSNWAYDHVAAADPHAGYVLESILTTQGDITYATADSTWTRLAKGTAGQRLRMNAGATAPEWAAGSATMQFFVPCFFGNGGALANHDGVYCVYLITDVNDYALFSFRIPNDFTATTSVKVIIIPTGTGTFDWTAATNFGANGEDSQTHTDSATANAQATTNDQLLELDISAAFTGLLANDIVGLIFTLDALDTTSQLNIVGLDIKYT